MSEVVIAEDGTNYMLYLPSNWSRDSEEPALPVLLFLHGAGGVQSEQNVRGISLGKMLSDEDFMRTDTMPSGFPFITIIPVAAQRGWQPQFQSIIGLVEMAHRELGGDPAHTYLAGQSMGGNGAWHLAAAYSSLFAAVVPVCGYIERDVEEPPKDVVDALATTPVWAFHSYAAASVRYANSCTSATVIMQQ